MSGWSGARRFYKMAAAVETPEGWTVALDERPIRTPGAKPFLCGPALAAAVADEWMAQGEQIDPTSMPATRAVNTAIERVAPQRDAVIDEIAAYGETDLVCYRAEAPETLIAREAAAWDPLLAWAGETIGARLIAVAGVMHAAQPAEAVARLRAAVAEESDIGLAALHELTTLSGSLVIALAVRRRRLGAEDAWAASRIDEEHQAELWGRDAEAEAAAAKKAAGFGHAARIGALDDADRATP